jgi:hypothetical protein
LIETSFLTSANARVDLRAYEEYPCQRQNRWCPVSVSTAEVVSEGILGRLRFYYLLPEGRLTWAEFWHTTRCSAGSIIGTSGALLETEFRFVVVDGSRNPCV